MLNRRSAWYWLAGSLALVLMEQTVAQSLPPPPSALPAQQGAARDEPIALRLELVINQRATGEVVPVEQRGRRYRVAAESLAGVQLPQGNIGADGWIGLSELPAVEVRYDAALQRLHLELPGDWLPLQQFGSGGAGEDWTQALSSPGALVGYEAYTSKASGGDATASLWHEASVFGMGGTWRSTGIYRQTLTERDGGSRDEGYRRYDTSWRLDDQERMQSWEVGDLITRPLGWSRAVRLGGVQLSRDFALRPDLVTYPLPTFSGSAEVPSTLDVFVDESRVAREQVSPGPFSLTNVPMISGAGEATLVTEDALGRRVTTTLPFYVETELLRPGLSSYSVGLGALRERYGQADFDYGALAASGSYRHGMSEYWTLEGHAEAAEDLATAGLGSAVAVGNLGTLELAYQGSYAESRSGEAYRLGYRYQGRRFNLGAQWETRGDGFADLSDLPELDRLQERSRAQLTASARLGPIGQVSAGYFEIDQGDSDRTRLVNLSYHRPLGRNVFLSSTASREIGEGWTGLLQFSVALGGGMGMVSSGAERSADGKWSSQLQYSRSAPLDGGLGWQLGHRQRHDADDYRQASASWRTRPVTLGAGVYGSGSDDVYFAEASGSVVAMAGQMFLANRINDSFVVVSTGDEGGVPVRYENQRVGITDDSGYLLVPWGSAYYPGKYEIDPLELPPEVATPMVEQRVAVEARSGYLLEFPLERQSAVTLALVGQGGQPLPLGSRVTTAEGRETVVGWDGLVYLEDQSQPTRLDVALPEGGQCSAEIVLPEGRPSVVSLGEVICQ